MFPSNSGNQEDSERLVTQYLPLLSISAVALPLLYAILCFNAVFLFEWLAFILLAILILRGLLMQEDAYLIWLGVSVNVVLPSILILFSVIKHHEQIGAHGLALTVLCAFAWVPALITLESAGGALKQIRQRNNAGEPLIASASFSRMLTFLVLLLGTFVFMQGEIVYSGNTSLLNPLLFAIPFYLVIWVLLSVARLVQKAYETPKQPIILAADFVGRWVGMMLTVLLVCAALALLLPKHPLLTILSHVNPQWQSALTDAAPPFLGLHPLDTPPPAADHSPFPRHDYRPLSPEQQPVNSAQTDASRWLHRIAGDGHAAKERPVSDAPSPQGKPGVTSGQKKPYPGGLPGLLARLRESTLDSLINIAKAGERHQEQKAQDAAENTQNAHNARPGDATTPAPKPAPDAEERTKSKLAALRELLRHHPLRLLKILLVISLVSAVFLAVILFFYARRKKWLQRVSGWLKRLFQSLLDFFLTFYGGRLADNRREHEIAKIMRQVDPFTDPLLNRGDRSPPQLVCAIYTTFIAYLWLGGYKRKVAQTEYGLAQWLEEGSPLNARAVWMITRAFTSVYYAKSIPTEEDLTLLHTALQTMIQDIERNVPEHSLEAMKGRYRHAFAEEKLAARLAEDAAQGEAALRPAEG